MKRKDRVKLEFTRNWALPGKERLSNWFKPSAAARLNLKDGITWLTGEDIAIFTTADNYIEWTLLSTGTYEEEISKLIRISLKAGDNALDIGANIGLQSLRMAQCAGTTGHVFSFEPLKYLQKKLSRNMSLNRCDHFTLFPFALSDKAGESEFQVKEDNWNQGTFSLQNKEQGGTAQQVMIKVADDLPEIQTLQNIALVKIDVEGFEFNVLKGLEATLKKHHPRIIFEYDDNYWTANGQKIGDCYTFLKGLNYELYQVGPVGCELIRQPEMIQSGNLFCL